MSTKINKYPKTKKDDLRKIMKNEMRRNKLGNKLGLSKEGAENLESNLRNDLATSIKVMKASFDALGLTPPNKLIVSNHTEIPLYRSLPRNKDFLAEIKASKVNDMSYIVTVMGIDIHIG